MVKPPDTLPLPPAAAPAPAGPARPPWPMPLDPPRPWGAVAGVLAFVELAVVGSILTHGSGPMERNFLERGSATLLSSAFLLTAGCLAATTFWTMRRDTRRARLMWGGLTAVLLFLGVDEVMEFHEQLGSYLGAREGAGPFRNWNDIVVLLYGAAALPAVLLFWREVRRYPRLLVMLAISAALYAATSAVDDLVPVPTSWSVIVEEGIKLHCSAFLALSMLTGLRAARWLRVVGRAR